MQPKMHEGEVVTDAALVERLLAAQFPQWAGLPVEPIPSAGTDHAIYRIGDELSVRLPRIGWALGQFDKERRWLPWLAPQLPLTVPVPVAEGTPGEGYPYKWSVYRWLRGENAIHADVPDLRRAALDLAEFIGALQRVDPTGGPEQDPAAASLATRDAGVREAIHSLRDSFDVHALTAAWDAALAAPGWDRAPVWFHGDMLPGNLLFEHGRLTAVIDFGSLAVGDPACDLRIAWAFFRGESRDAYRTALAVDDATWARGRGHALMQAVIFIPYYVDTNPVGVAAARRSLEEVLADASTWP